MAFDADRVRDIAAAQISDDPEGGAALAVIIDGETVLDWTGGLADAEAGTAYTADTLQIAQSMGKGAIAAVAAQLMTRGQLDPNKRVAAYWPAFGTHDKRDITVAQLLSHQAGLVYLDGGFTTGLSLKRANLESALVAQSPAWKPGTKVGYSPLIWGNYADFLFQYATGKGLTEHLDELTTALKIEMYVGLSSDKRHRAARVLASPSDEAVDFPTDVVAAMTDPDSLLMKVAKGFPESLTPEPIGLVNSDRMRDSFIPAANLHSSAHAFATLYDAMLRSSAGPESPVWSQEVLEMATREWASGIDAVFPMPCAFGLGFQKPSTTFPFSPSTRAFGHGGAGGSFAMADPDKGLAVCWLPTRYTNALFDNRQQVVLAAVRDAAS